MKPGAWTNLVLTGLLLLAGCSSKKSTTPDGNPDTWKITVGGAGSDAARALVADGQGGVVVAGFSLNGSDIDAYVIRIDAQGEIVWEEKYGNSALDRAFAITGNGSGGFAFAGQSIPDGSNLPDFYLVNLNASGAVVWSKTIGTQWQDEGRALVRSQAGAYLIAGGTVPGLQYDPYVALTDANGTVLWQNRYQLDALAFLQAAVESPTGGFLLAGSSLVPTEDQDVLVLRIDADGDTLWSRTFGDAYDETANAIIASSDGNFVVVGTSVSYPGGAEVLGYIAKVNSNGDVVWSKTLGGARPVRLNGICEVSGGGYAVVGSREVDDAGQYDAYLAFVSNEGDVISEKTYGGNADERGTGVVQADDGGFVICGSTESSGAGGSDVYVVRTDANGDL